MSTLAVMGLMALLFILFGLVRPRASCNGRRCASCGLHCHLHSSDEEDHHV